MFKGRDNGGLDQLFWNDMQEIYDRLIIIDAVALDIPDGNHTSISEVTKALGDGKYVKFDPKHLLYLLEYFKINSLYARMECPYIFS